MASDPAAQSPGDISIIKNEAASRYEISLDSQRVGLADYLIRTEPDGVAVIITHTETTPALQGRGLAGQLIRFALDDIAAAGQKVVPACPYVADYIHRHPEYRLLVA